MTEYRSLSALIQECVDEPKQHLCYLPEISHQVCHNKTILNSTKGKVPKKWYFKRKTQQNKAEKTLDLLPI